MKKARRLKKDMIDNKIRVIITNNQKTVKIPTGLRMLVRRCCNAVLKLEDFQGPAEISVTFTDNAQIKVLNAQYRNKDVETDVLSFPMGENGKYDLNMETGAQILGDIVISMEKAVEQSDRFGHSLQREVGYLTAHSMLHLLGYDHEENNLERVRMREKEELVMEQLGLPASSSYIVDDEDDE
jgi:probable rRNA maturation factor